MLFSSVCQTHRPCLAFAMVFSSAWKTLHRSSNNQLLLEPQISERTGHMSLKEPLPGLLNCVITMKFHAAAAAAVFSVVSDSVRPHRWQPIRLPRPWDSPGKNIGVGCHFLLQCMKVKSESEVAQSCPTLRDPMDCSLPGSSIHGIFQARVLEWAAIAFSSKYMLAFMKKEG